MNLVSLLAERIYMERKSKHEYVFISMTVRSDLCQFAPEASETRANDRNFHFHIQIVREISVIFLIGPVTPPPAGVPLHPSESSNRRRDGGIAR